MRKLNQIRSLETQKNINFDKHLKQSFKQTYDCRVVFHRAIWFSNNCSGGGAVAGSFKQMVKNYV